MMFTMVMRTVDCSVEMDVTVKGQLELVKTDDTVVRRLETAVIVEEVLLVRVLVYSDRVVA